MTDITLTPQEKRELEKRGFLVKKNFGFGDLVKQTIHFFQYLFIICFPSLAGIALMGNLFSKLYNITGTVHYLEQAFGIGIILYSVAPLLQFIRSFLKSGLTFFGKIGELSFGEITENPGNNRGVFLLDKVLNKMVFGKGDRFVLSSILPISFLYGIPLLIYTAYLTLTNATTTLISFLQAVIILTVGYIVTFAGILFLLYLLRSIFQTINPLYAFGNLGEKIQKLTPQISEKSKEIQKSFASDMNYTVLSDGFDGLASTFSQIVSLVIRLERVGARANKGNLFDSERYISSLRSDIVGPLRSLRSFLDTRRTELTASHEELSRVRVQVGGTSEHRDLASARTGPLMTELTENIERLDMMIEKMG